MRVVLLRNTSGHVPLLRKNQTENQKLGRGWSASFISEVLELASIKNTGGSQVRCFCDVVKISSACYSLFRRCGFALWEGTVLDGINSCGQKSNCWQFSSSGPPSPKLQITRGISLSPALASSSAESPDSPHHMVLTPEHSNVSIRFPH